MMEFAVTVEGLDENQGKWVLDVDPARERFLVAHDDGTLHWHLITECKFVRAANPDVPRPVIPMQPQQQQKGLAIAKTVVLGDNGRPLR